MLARLDAQMEVVTKACVKRTPFAARSSMFGVCIMGLPMQDIVSQRWSSVSRKMIFGGAIPKAFGFEAATRPQPVIGIAAVAAVPAMSFTNWRRLRFSVFG